MTWTHNQLANDLASHLRGNTDAVIWTDMQLGPSGSPRPDCYRIAKSYAKFQPLAYEIKISKADYRRDVTAGKWQRYLDYAAGVIFAIPAGLIPYDEIPKGCGLIVRFNTGWRMMKAPTLKHIDTLPREAWLKLMIDGLERESKRAQYHESRSYHFARNTFNKRFGERVASLVYDLNNAENNLTMAIAETTARRNKLREEISAEVEGQVQSRLTIERARHTELTRNLSDLAIVLGLPVDVDPTTLSRAVREAANRLQSDDEICRLQRLFNDVKNTIDKATKPLPGLAPAE